MAATGLIDTGAIIAILDASESRHNDCTEALAAMHLPLLTSEAVVTELFHLIHGRGLSAAKTWDFVRSGAITLQPISDGDMPALRELMEDYADRPMDFADATLVHIAARERLSTILTIDHDDFETYRLPGRKKFSILPRRRGM